MKYAVLGGAGSMGRIVVRDLLEFSEAGDEIVIADFDLAAAKALVRSLPKRRGRLSAARVDVRNLGQAQRALRKTFVLINCVQYQLNLEAMEIALAVGAHYVDLGGLFHMTRKQLKWTRRFQDADKTALLGMGAAPGITNLLAKEACARLERVQEIHLRVAGVDKTRYHYQPALPVSYSLQTILEELSVPPAVFTGGRFTFAAPMSGATVQRFPSPIGDARPFYTLHSEVATLPVSYARQGVREVSFKIAFAPEFLAKVQFIKDLGLAAETPVRIRSAEVKPIELVNRIAMSQRRSVPAGPLRQHEVVRAVVKGFEEKRKRVTWVMDCQTSGMPTWGIGTDINTGSPPAIAARMLAHGDIQRRGAVSPEEAVPTDPFFAELTRRKMRVKSTQCLGWNVPV